MKRTLPWVISLAALAVLLAAVSGCRKDEPKSIGEARQAREGTWQNKWSAEDQEARREAGKAAAEAPAEPTATSPTIESGPAWTGDADDMHRDEDAEKAEERRERQETAERDKEMPGEYK